MKSLSMIASLLICLFAALSPIAHAAHLSDGNESRAQSFAGAWKGNFETSAFSVTMELSLANEGSQASATVKFSEGTRVEMPAPRELKLHETQIAFAVLLDGLELKFTGVLNGDTLAGTAEGFRDGTKIGAGKWQLSRVTIPATTASLPTPTLAAQTAVHDADTIKQVIQRYLDVTDKKDAEAIKQAFHPDTKLLSVGKNGLNQMSLEEWWGRVSRIPGKVKRKSEVTVLEISGLAAIIKIDFGSSKDFVSLLKINGEWKIVSKILSTSLN